MFIDLSEVTDLILHNTEIDDEPKPRKDELMNPNQGMFPNTVLCADGIYRQTFNKEPLPMVEK